MSLQHARSALSILSPLESNCTESSTWLFISIRFLVATMRLKKAPLICLVIPGYYFVIPPRPLVAFSIWSGDLSQKKKNSMPFRAIRFVCFVYHTFLPSFWHENLVLLTIHMQPKRQNASLDIIPNAILITHGNWAYVLPYKTCLCRLPKALTTCWLLLWEARWYKNLLTWAPPDPLSCLVIPAVLQVRTGLL